MSFSKCFVLVLGIFVLVSMIQVEAADSLASSSKAISYQSFLQAFFNILRNVLEILEKIFGKDTFLFLFLTLEYPLVLVPATKESEKKKL